MSTKFFAFYFAFIMLVFFVTRTEGLSIRFQNIICRAEDPKFIRFDTCKITAVSRKSQYITVKAGLLERPLTKFRLRFFFMQRLNGWKPFLYDWSIGCNFTKTLNKLTSLVWDIVRNISNFNTDCPYYQETVDIPRAENTYFQNILKMLPIPTGVYGLFIQEGTEAHKRVHVEIHIQVS
ncbi:uncharacterized protein LOC109612354 [Musca domestica]|uniref:Uncharacterized protein LOC109612354 n=1 Tax=Musca domestica TaxID=7370 RepID=A0A9J7DEY4_MUSDO|nr:uncharacterized protein LOC109612354 [Musca domestica]